MTWRVNFVRSKDAQKQLARTSLRLDLQKYNMQEENEKGENMKEEC